MNIRDITEEDMEDMADEDREDIERRLEYLTIAENIDDVRAEIAMLDKLISQADEVRKQEIESKLVGLRDVVLKNLGEKKLLIFTEFRDTLEYLCEKLKHWGYKIVTIHGQMNMDARIQAEHEFRDNAQIMVATEAAGEGINLQFCSLMINYDIPWNPNRLEQRMGRIHRYGQQYEVHIWNAITKDTREGQILEKLFDKLNSMREALGSDRVFDIIGQIIPDSRFEDLLRDAIFNQRRMEDIEQHIEAVDEKFVRKTLEEVFLTSLATRHIDYTGILKETLEAEENRLVPEYVGDYFLRAFRRLGGKIERRGEKIFHVPSVPYDLRKWNEDYAFKTTYGNLFREYQRLTFDKAFARGHPEIEFIAPGHPLLEAVNQQVLVEFSANKNKIALFGDPEGQREGVFWFVEGEVTDGGGETSGKRVFCLYQGIDGVIQKVNPAILWDHEPLRPDQAQICPEISLLLSNRETIEDHIVSDVLMPFRDEIASRREKEAAIKEKYGVRSLEYLIQESNQKILDYQGRQSIGEAVDLPLLNEQRNLEMLQQRRNDLEKEIRLEKNLTVSEPRILGAAIVLSLKSPQTITSIEPVHQFAEEKERYQCDTSSAKAGMRRDEEVEAIGMIIAMQYEHDQGWNPEDVHTENLGFDIRSTRYNPDGTFSEIRYIEVKGRAQSGDIRISANEWKKARHFGEKFWLYVVTYTSDNKPLLNRIKNPDIEFKIDIDIFVTGFLIPEENWKKSVIQESHS